MAKYPMYTGEVYDNKWYGDFQELYYKIMVPLNNLSSLSSLLDELIMKRDF